MNCGGTTVIANGNDPRALDRIFAGEKVGTAFLPAQRMRGKRRWIAYAADVRGRVVVDAGAHRAITQGKASLLASGIVRVENHFAPMDVVSIVDSEGREFARGIANCASEDAEKSSGKQSRPRGAGFGAFGRACDARQYRAVAEIMSQHRSQRRSTAGSGLGRVDDAPRPRGVARTREAFVEAAQRCAARCRESDRAKRAQRFSRRMRAIAARRSRPSRPGNVGRDVCAAARQGTGVAQMAAQIREVARMEDPLGRRLAATELDKGLVLHRESCPIGVIGVIFESRPDVVPQFASLALKSGNAVILKGGSEAAHTNEALVSIWRDCLKRFPAVPPDSISLLQIARGRAGTAGDGSRRRSDYPARLVRARSLHHGAQPHSRARAWRGNLPRVRRSRRRFAERPSISPYDAKVQYPAVAMPPRRCWFDEAIAHEISAAGGGEAERGGSRNSRLRENLGAAAERGNRARHRTGLARRSTAT